MLMCLWKGCEFAVEELAAFQEHVLTTHVQQPQPQQQLNLDDKQNVGPNKEEMVEDTQIIAKLNQEENKMIKSGGGKRKFIFLAIEIWVDVLGFIKRIQLARSVCLVNFKIYEICWPRLHGNKVMAHSAKGISIGYSDESGAGHPPTALLLQNLKKVPFPECLPPDYITGFGYIQIRFLDHQVLAFFSLIASRITTNKVRIQFRTELRNIDENQLACVNQLLQIFREKITTIPSMHFDCNLSSLQFLADADNKMKTIDCYATDKESDNPILMQFLASPRPDGQQRVMKIYFCEEYLLKAQKLLEDIKEEFRTSTQPVPQPYFLQFQANLNIPSSEEENLQTDEILTIMPNRRNWYFHICRHPRGQHEQWAEDARKRLNILPIDESTTYIIAGISEFGECSSPWIPSEEK